MKEKGKNIVRAKEKKKRKDQMEKYAKCKKENKLISSKYRVSIN
jgi:hypothetical protein